jgi:eukaryotic-like serine/threonine-protein kinase
MFSFLTSKSFVRNLVFSIIFYVAIIWIVLRWISSYTLHGVSIEVPDLKGKSMNEVASLLKEKELRFQIVDSVYAPDKKKGSVIDQNPSPGFQVKKSRTIYLTMNAMNPPMVKMPNLKDASFRQAKAMLETYGLQVADTRSVPGEKDLVFNAFFKGKKLKAGDELLQGSGVILEVGDPALSEKIDVPRLIGLSRREALKLLKELALLPGAEVFDNTVKDSAQVRVYRQIPAYRSGASMLQGKSVDLFFTQDNRRIELANDSIASQDDD